MTLTADPTADPAPPPAPPPAGMLATGLLPPGTAMLALLGEAMDAVDRLRAVPPETAQTAELGQLTAGLARLEAQVHALGLEVLAEADRRHVADQTADTGTDAWAAKLTGERREVMAGGLALARSLRERFHHTREAFAVGSINLAQVKVICRATDKAPADASPDQVRAAEEWLVDQATGAGRRSGRGLDARQLRQAARRMFAHLDADLALRHEAALLDREQREAEAMTYLILEDNGNGRFTGKFEIPELHGHLLLHALHLLTAPRRLGRDKNGEQVEDATVITSNRWETWGAALCELLEHLPTRGHAANGVNLLVTIGLDRLIDGLGSAGLDTGVRIGAGEARRLACNAGIIPAVLDGTSQPLDLGRTKRLHTPAQRAALALTHDSCGIAGCERPFAWCEVHHPHAWSDGGVTELNNALPFCGHHHRRAHDSRYDLRRHSSGEWRFHPRR